MSFLVRTWNVFHGNTLPPERRGYLAEAIRLVSADRPDVLCLQEIPAWALPLLPEWSGMTAVAEVAARPTFGPVPSTAAVGRAITSVHHGFFRSAFTGQGNAILVASPARPADCESIVLNTRRFRRAQADWLGLDIVARAAWAKERRICLAARVHFAAGESALVANLHATSYPADRRLPDAELLRAAVFADALARPDEPCIVAGDFNVFAPTSRTLADLSSPEWGFSRPTPSGVDHVLVRGAPSQTPEEWPLDRRRLGRRVLSDHPPVEVRVG